MERAEEVALLEFVLEPLSIDFVLSLLPLIVATILLEPPSGLLTMTGWLLDHVLGFRMFERNDSKSSDVVY